MGIEWSKPLVGVLYNMGNNISNRLFVHTADLHLAPRQSTIAKRDPATSRLIRDLDMDNALKQAINDALSQPTLPSAFVIAGDIFDTYKGSPEAFITCISQIKRITSAGIHVIGIAGNHDTPTNSMKTPMFSMLEGVFSDNELVTLAYDEIKRVIVGDVEYVLLPHSVCLKGEFEEADIKPSGDSPFSVLIVHGVAAGDPSLKQMDEAKEIPIAKWILDLEWSYVAFGHYHKPGWITGYVGKAAYCGSLENTVISGPDVCMTRGPVYVDFNKTGTDLYDMHPMKIRCIKTLPDIDVTGADVDADELIQQIEELIYDSDVDGAIVLHKVKGITRSLYKTLPHRAFQYVCPEVLYIRTDFELAEGVENIIAVETDNTDVTENGGIAATADDEFVADESFHPLDKEMENALAILIAQGAISSQKKEEVLKILHGYVE